VFFVLDIFLKGTLAKFSPPFLSESHDKLNQLF